MDHQKEITFYSALDDLVMTTFNIDPIYFNTLRSMTISTLIDAFRKHRILLHSRALYKYPRKSDGNASGYLEHYLTELQCVGKTHGKDSDAYRVCWNLCVKMIWFSRMFLVPTGIDPQELVKRLL